MKIGIFDSGIGGLSVTNAVKKAFPEHDVIYRHDKEHIPYGNKTPQELFGFVLPILTAMQDEGCQTIVVACNTVTTTIIQELRKQLKIPLIAVEPMVKPASEQTKSKIIAVCATPTTLASKRYTELKYGYASGVTVIEPDCSNWSSMIETDTVDRTLIEQTVKEACEQGADVIVLGCTHYHWIETEIQQVARQYDAIVLQPEPAIIAELKRVLARLP